MVVAAVAGMRVEVVLVGVGDLFSMDAHLHTRCRQSAAFDSSGPKFCRQPELGDLGAQEIDIEAGIYQSPEDHVAADPGIAVEMG